MLKNLESRCIDKGRVVFLDFDDLVYVRSMFSHIGFECLLEINEQIYTHFMLEFYSQYLVNYTLEGQMLIEFVIQNQFFSYTLEEFGQILGIPSNGACSFIDNWSLDDLQYSVPTSGPYQTNPICPDEIKNYVQEEREGPGTQQDSKKIMAREEVASTSSLSAFGQPLSSHLHHDDNDGNDEGISRASTPSPTRFVNSLTNRVP
ncbi:hypothetical protein Tco_1013044 [Tanacetum coccineum]